MSNLTAQITEITNEISELQERIDGLRVKRQALAKLESTYNETVIIVQETAALMVQAGLDPKVLATEIRQLIAPRKAKSEPVETTEEYEVIEVPQVTPAPAKPISTPAPTPAPTQAPKQIIVTTPAPTPSPNSYGFTTTSKNYGRVESKKAPTTVETSPTTPEPTKAPTATTEVPVSDWSLVELKEFCRKYWAEPEITAFMKDKKHPKTSKTGWVLIASRIRAKLYADKKSA